MNEHLYWKELGYQRAMWANLDFSTWAILKTLWAG